jgi:hypothetical protein
MLVYYSCIDTKSATNVDRVCIPGLLRLLAASTYACRQSWQVPTDGAWISTDSAKHQSATIPSFVGLRGDRYQNLQKSRLAHLAKAWWSRVWLLLPASDVLIHAH